MRTVEIFQPQYTSLVGDTPQPWLPYSAACLWAYAQSHQDIASNWQLGRLHYERLPIDQVLTGLDDPSLCAFSCYVWNEQYNLALAQAVKQRWPECVIVFGGPQSGINHIDCDFIDCIVLSEGETSFVEILRTITAGQSLEKVMRRERLLDLDIPSPYLLGLFDDIIAKASPNTRFQTVLETNRGCPYACTYCDWGGLTYSKIKRFSLERIEQELLWIARNPVSVVFLADANFGIFKERDMEIARLFRRHLTGSAVEYMNITFTKNSNRTIFDITREIGPIVKSVTLSMQTMNPQTLKTIKRENMKSNDLAEMLSLAKEYNIPTYTDMILGLPDETLESWRQGLMTLLELGQDGFIDTNLTNVLENTELNKIQRGVHRIKTVMVEDYLGDSHLDDTGIMERTELVVSTNTMSRDDMIMSWMWHWLVQFFHTAGYSHLASRFAHQRHGTPFVEFYTDLLQRVEQDASAIGQEFHRIKRAITNLLTDGNFGSEIDNVYEFYIASYPIFYQHRGLVFELVDSTAKSLNCFSSDVALAQRHAIINPEFPPGAEIDMQHDINTWRPGHHRYKVKSNITQFQGSLGEFQRMRRGSFWKNQFESLDTPSKNC